MSLILKGAKKEEEELGMENNNEIEIEQVFK